MCVLRRGRSHTYHSFLVLSFRYRRPPRGPRPGFRVLPRPGPFAPWFSEPERAAACSVYPDSLRHFFLPLFDASFQYQRQPISPAPPPCTCPRWCAAALTLSSTLLLKSAACAARAGRDLRRTILPPALLPLPNSLSPSSRHVSLLHLSPTALQPHDLYHRFAFFNRRLMPPSHVQSASSRRDASSPNPHQRHGSQRKQHRH